MITLKRDSKDEENIMRMIEDQRGDEMWEHVDDHKCITCTHLREVYLHGGDWTDTTQDGGADCDYFDRETIEIIDNGGGFWITSCSNYSPDQQWYSRYISSQHFRELRAERLKKDDYRCHRCRSAKNLHCHHITYERIGREDIDDVVMLCGSCHSTIHGMNNKWIAVDNTYTRFKCGNCSSHSQTRFDYCPHCGAYMQDWY